MTYLPGAGLLSAEDKEIIRNEVGAPALIIPKGESEYAKKLQKEEKLRKKSNRRPEARLKGLAEGKQKCAARKN